MQPIFITGTGTGVGKTVVAAIITEALQADYWKPIQAGFENGTDSLTVKELVSNDLSVVHPEVYKLSLAASPHIAAKEDNKVIDLKKIERSSRHLSSVNDYLIIEGPGGIMVPLNSNEFVVDMIGKLKAKVIIVSRNYLGSINHSLLTAQVCKEKELDVLGWIFNDEYLNYETEIVEWSGYSMIGKISHGEVIDKDFILRSAELLRPSLMKFL